MTSRPGVIYHVSQSQLSVARHFGGCKYNGADYHYDAATDTLTRLDIWRAKLASDKEMAARVAKEERAKWEKVKDMQKSFVGGDDSLLQRNRSFCGSVAKAIDKQRVDRAGGSR